MFSSTSAMLNTGKLRIDIKSLTHHRKNLSARFQIVPAIKKINIIHDIYLILNKYVNIKRDAMLIEMIINIFACIHRDIHKLNTGLIKSRLDSRDLL